MTPEGPHPGEQREPADRDPLSRLFAGPTDEDRARLRADLLVRAAQVRADGWEPYRGLWSTGEMIGVATLLAAHAELAALGETMQSAWERWAFDLWGLDGGQSDVDNKCDRTRDWFLDAAYELAGGETVGDRFDGPSAEGTSMSELLAADSGHDIDFEPGGLRQPAREVRPRRTSYSEPRDEYQMSPMPDRWSAEDYNSWRETVYLLSSPENARRLLEAVARDKAGMSEAGGLDETIDELAVELLDRYKAYVRRYLEEFPQRGLGHDSSAEIQDRRRATALGLRAELPRDWSIIAAGQSVEVVVPASGADGYFVLGIDEAVAAGLALIQQAQQARLTRLEARKRAIEQTSGSLGGAYGTDYLNEEREGWDE